ncbi:uncharacterized protein LOC113351147 [Papaver somniferum]|uniref:uncharacterized protein LOC113351147 n=1 Tax=Papaver somniferum TaxID=3469 RepID=UPI000E704D3B|nr:uncharacterized protein LOC113351147 [Papaver somniferum]
MLIQSHPIDQDLARREIDYVAEYVKLAKYEESSLKQQSGVKWLNFGDSNTSFFHNSLKERRSRNNILFLYNNENVKVSEDKDIANECVFYYSHLFGSDLEDNGNDDFLSLRARWFFKPFFKTIWSIVGDDLVAAVQNFFTKSKLLKEVNSTFITLTAKNKNPSVVSDYMPISCCNVIYKCITKIISLRMKKILGGLISQNQSAFISGRSIQDNIMLAHELVRNYHRSTGSPRCALKIDLRKAYDTFFWSLKRTETRLSNFSIFVCACNGDVKCYSSQTGADAKFWFPPKVQAYKLTHLCFADDIMLFLKGTSSAASSIKNALNEFSLCTGLELNNQKTSLFYSAIENDILQQIINILDCSMGELPKRFLWSGAEMKKSYNPICWTYLSHAYEEGVLGVKSLEYTNVAANLRHIWDLKSGKETIWTNWVKSNLIKHHYFWTMHVPQDFSWCWRRILEHKDLAKKHIGILLGDGNNTRFLHDNWHSKGRLVDWVDSNTLETIGATHTTKVAEFISNENWNLPSYIEDNVQDMVQQITTADFNIHESDQYFWKSSITGQFSMKHTYLAISDHLRSLPWNCLVWFKKHIPVHSFIACLALHRRLKTRSKLLSWGVISDASCVLCGEEGETGHDSVDIIKRLVLNGFIYHILRERNNRIFRSSFNSQDQVSLLIFQDVRFEMSTSICMEEDNVHLRWFMSRWRINFLFIQPDIIECTWLAPANDKIIINTNGSKSDDAGSFGAILRDHNAEVLSAASGDSPPISVLAHERHGVELGLKMAIKFDKLRVHIDEY